MKLILLYLVLSQVVYANDLIYLNGFENKALVSGVVTGLNSSGLVLELSATDGQERLEVSSNSEFVFNLPVTTGNQWQVNLYRLPAQPVQQSCVISNFSGTMPAFGVNNLIVECSDESWRWNQMNWNEGGWQ